MPQWQNIDNWPILSHIRGVGIVGSRVGKGPLGCGVRGEGATCRHI